MSREYNLEKIFVRLHRIIPFSNVEGMGNRCSIFLQGCNINCLYCHNPETIDMNNDEAKLVSLAYLLNEVKKSIPFIRGVTISGGEPTLHYKKLIPLFMELKKLNLSCYLDSNGFFDFNRIYPLIVVTDKFLFDIKGLGKGLDTLCFDIDNKKGVLSFNKVKPAKIIYHNLTNLVKLLEMDKVEEVRLVHIKDFYDVNDTILKIMQIIKPYPHVIFKLIRVHAKGSRDENYIKNHVPTIIEHKQAYDYAKSLGINPVVLIN